MVLDFIAFDIIAYLLAAWAVIFACAKLLRLEKRGAELKFYSLTYENSGIEPILITVLRRTRMAVRALADIGIVAGFLTLGLAFWFLLSNILYHLEDLPGSVDLIMFVPGVTVTSLDIVVYVLLSMPIVVLMHEASHGMAAALEKIKVRGGGISIFLVTMSGFVDTDADEFEKAKKIPKIRVIMAGVTANMLFALALGAILLTNPAFALFVPEPLRETFYEETEGMTVLSVIEGSGADAAGLVANDTIVAVGDLRIRGHADLARAGMVPGDTVRVDVLRDGQPVRLDVLLADSSGPGRGLLGIIPDNASAYKPVLDFIIWENHHVFIFLFWLWLISLVGGLFNMLPLPSTDGDRLVRALVPNSASGRAVRAIMYGLYTFTSILVALNLAIPDRKSVV